MSERIGEYSIKDCKLAESLYKNEIGEICCWCAEFEHRNIELGQCFGNCDWQDEDVENVQDCQH